MNRERDVRGDDGENPLQTPYAPPPPVAFYPNAHADQMLDQEVKGAATAGSGLVRRANGAARRQW
eukprot:4310685-Pleurochrysis_carterae.AAC.3